MGVDRLFNVQQDRLIHRTTNRLLKIERNVQHVLAKRVADEMTFRSALKELQQKQSKCVSKACYIYIYIRVCIRCSTVGVR